MVRRTARQLRVALLPAVLAFGAGCSSHLRTAAPTVTPGMPPAQAGATQSPADEPSSPDPVLALNASAGDGFTEKSYEPASIDALLALSATFTESPAELVEAVAADLERVGYDVPVPFNQKVLSYIDLFQGRLHDFIQEGLTRGSKYLPMIQSVFRAEGLPLDLAYIPLIESAFKANALSRAKAKGVWQFMRGTAVENGLRHDWYIDERSDPEKATMAAAKYLSALSKMFEGDWHLALASYNGGPGRVQRAMKRGGLTDFWKLAAKPSLLPRETR